MAGRNSCHASLFQGRKTECCFFRTVFCLLATVSRYPAVSLPEPVWLCNGSRSGNRPAAFFRFEMVKVEYDWFMAVPVVQRHKCIWNGSWQDMNCMDSWALWTARKTIGNIRYIGWRLKKQEWEILRFDQGIFFIFFLIRSRLKKRVTSTKNSGV